MIGREVAPGDWEVKALNAPQLGQFKVSVAGVTHFKSSLKIVHTERGDKCKAEFLLVADPKNPASKSAVGVYALGIDIEPEAYLVGYLPKAISKDYYDLIVENELDGVYVRGIVGKWVEKFIFWVKLDLAPVDEMERRIVK